MKFSNIIKEELTVQSINKAIINMENNYKQIKDLTDKNQATIAPIAKGLAGFEKEMNNMKLLATKLAQEEKIKGESGVGKQVKPPLTPPTVAKPAASTIAKPEVSPGVKKI